MFEIIDGDEEKKQEYQEFLGAVESLFNFVNQVPFPSDWARIKSFVADNEKLQSLLQLLKQKKDASINGVAPGELEDAYNEYGFAKLLESYDADVNEAADMGVMIENIISKDIDSLKKPEQFLKYVTEIDGYYKISPTLQTPQSTSVPQEPIQESKPKSPDAPRRVNPDSVRQEPSPDTANSLGLPIASPPSDVSSITTNELATLLTFKNANIINLPVSVRSKALEAFFNDPKISPAVKKFVKDKFEELSKAKDDQIPGLKKQLEYLLNFPGWGLARDKRVDQLDDIVVRMKDAAALVVGNRQEQDQAANKVLEQEIARIDQLCSEATSGVLILKDKFIASYKRELWDKYNYRLNNPTFRTKNSNEQYPEPKESYYPPISLDGPPGTGKTTVCKEIAEIFGFGFSTLDMQTVTDLSQIIGRGTEFQGGGEASRIVQIKVASGTNAVLMVLDEVDRVPNDQVLGGLAGLLAVNSDSGKIISDKYFNLEIPATGIGYIATTNNHYNLKEYLQNRLSRISFPGKSVKEKIEIINKNLLKLDAIDYVKDYITQKLTDELKQYLVEAYSYDPGVRVLGLAYNALVKKMINDCMGKGTADFPTIDKQYIDNCMKAESIRKLTDKQQEITKLAQTFQELRDSTDLSKKVKIVDELLAALNVVLDERYLKQHGFEKDAVYKNYADELKNYVQHEVLLYKNEQAKVPLRGKQYLDNQQDRFNKLAIKQQLLIEKMKSIDIEIRYLNSQLGANSDNEKTKPIITRLAALKKQHDSLQERIDFSSSRLKAMSALINSQSIEPVILQQLISYRDKLIQQKSSQIEEERDKTDKKVANINKLLIALDSLPKAVPSDAMQPSSLDTRSEDVRKSSIVTVTDDSNANEDKARIASSEASLLEALRKPYRQSGEPAKELRSSTVDQSLDPQVKSAQNLNEQPVVPVTFSMGSTISSHGQSAFNKQWIEINPPEPTIKIPNTPPESINSVCAYMDLDTRKVEAIGNPPEPRQFIINKVSNSSILHAQLNVVDQEMIVQMIKKRMSTNGQQPVFINGLCDITRPQEQNEHGIEMCKVFLNICMEKQLYCTFDDKTLSVLSTELKEKIKNQPTKPSASFRGS